MKCLKCDVNIDEFLGIKSIESTNPAGWVELVTKPVQLCIDCAVMYFDDDDIVSWEDDEE